MLSKSTLSGLLIICFGLFFLLLSLPYNKGSLDNIGPGFFPMAISIITIVCGIITIFTKND